jgi:hypothetical protein
MARPDDDNEFGLRDVRAPVQRAQEVAKRHEAHGWLEKTWSFTKGAAYASVVLNPLTLPAVLALDPRFRRVSLAVARSLTIAPTLMLDESLGVGQGLLQGIIPMLGELAKWAGGGALIGGAIGAVGGLGVLDEATIPGGILFGFEAGLMIGGFWALKDLLIEAAKHLHTFINYSIDAAELAWYAGEDEIVSEDQDINAAAKLFAVAISELWWVILQALVAWVLKRAGGLLLEAGAGAIEGTMLERALVEASEKSAKFGKPFTDWFKTNFTKIRGAVERRQKALKQLQEGDSGGSDAGASGAGGNKPASQQSSTPSGQYRDSNGRLRNADGTFARDPSVPVARLNRANQYPHGNDPAVRAKIIADNTNADGQVIDPETGQVIPPDQVTIEHQQPVVDQWNTEGYNQTRAQRNAWYNDPSNLTVKPKSVNSSEGAQLGQTYRQDTGPDYGN